MTEAARDYRYVVDRDGRIFHDGTEIVDPAVLRFFLRAMTRTDDFNQATEIVTSRLVSVTDGALQEGDDFRLIYSGVLSIGTTPLTFVLDRGAVTRLLERDRAAQTWLSYRIARHDLCFRTSE